MRFALGTVSIKRFLKRAKTRCSGSNNGCYMILWRKGGNYNVANYTVHVALSVEYSNSDFIKDGKPIQIAVAFRYGKTYDLPSNLAQYLLDKGLAQESRLIL